MNNNVFIKTISFILICAMLFCLSACGGSGNFEKEQEEKEFVTLTWTENSFAEKVPTPKSTLGYINNNNRSMFEVYLSDFTLDEFNEYVDACVEMGYTVEQNRQDAFFYAQTEDYYEVRVEHEDGNIIHIAISEVEYDVEIKVIRANNSSKCEVEIEIDGYYEEEIESGDMVASFDSYLNVGTHELRVINTEDDDIYGTIFFDVTSDSYYEFEINCTDVEVEISARGEANGQQGENGNESTADKDFLAEIEAAVLERMDTPTNTNRERRIAVDAELYQIKPFAEKEFLDDQLKQLVIRYIEGLELQKEASEAEYDYEKPITWYEGLVACYEVLNVLHQNYDFLTDNSKFMATYVSQLNEKQALLAAYKAVEEDLSEQCTGELVNDYDGTNMSLTFREPLI